MSRKDSQFSLPLQMLPRYLVNPLHPNISIHILHTLLCFSFGAEKEKLFNDQSS